MKLLSPRIVLLFAISSLIPQFVFLQTIPMGYRSLAPLPIDMGDHIFESLKGAEQEKYCSFLKSKNEQINIVDQLEFLHGVLEDRLLANYQINISKLLAKMSELKSPQSIKDISLNMDLLSSSFQDSLLILNDILSKSKEYDFLAQRNKFFPAKSSVESQLFYRMSAEGNRSRFLNHIYLSVNNTTDQVSLYNELFADYLGPVRMSFGTLISSSSSEEDSSVERVIDTSQSSNALHRLTGGGGNGVVVLSYPMYYWGNDDLSNGIRMSFVPKLSIDIPELGSHTETVVKNMDLAFELNGYYVGHNDVISLFFNNRFGRVMGGEGFYQSVDSDGAFFLNHCTFGFSIGSNFLLSYNWFYTNDGKLKNQLKGFLSFSVIPSM